MARKSTLSAFLSKNPFESPLTLGFFYREKMRAIHRVSPAEIPGDILDVGGGRGGLTQLLYPGARIVNIDLNAAYADAPCNREPNVSFACADATRLPFPDSRFDAVAMFDLLEHVPDDAAAVAEAFRVLRPGGVLLASSPNLDWRFPYYRVLRPICPAEEEMFEEWGHVRRGYTREQMESLAGRSAESSATFINPLTVVAHDFAFSRLPRIARKAICTALLPVTWAAYLLHSVDTRGTETAFAFRKPVGTAAGAESLIAAG